MKKNQKPIWIAVVVLMIAAAVIVFFWSAGKDTDRLTDEAEKPFELKSLFAQAEHTQPLLKQNGQDEPMIDRVLKDNESLGYLIRLTQEGYAGPIEITVGVNENLMIRGVLVGGKDFKETEGIGSKVKEPSFTQQFQNQSAPVKIGETVDTIAGATVSSTAVIEGVNRACERLYQLLDAPVSPAAQASHMPEKTLTGEKQGYGGPVWVKVMLDSSGAVERLTVGDERFAETDGLGSLVRQEAFTSQFIGKKPPFALGEGIDGISGATVSSTAVVEAINQAAQQK